MESPESAKPVIKNSGKSVKANAQLFFDKNTSRRQERKIFAQEVSMFVELATREEKTYRRTIKNLKEDLKALQEQTEKKIKRMEKNLSKTTTELNKERDAVRRSVNHIDHVVDGMGKIRFSDESDDDSETDDDIST